MSKRSNRLVAWVAAGMVLGSTATFALQETENLKRLRETRMCMGCNFQGIEVQALDAQATQLQKADFRGARLYKPNFTKANLIGANFGQADLQHANFDGANLKDATGLDLSSATTTDRTTCPSGAAGPCR